MVTLKVNSCNSVLEEANTSLPIVFIDSGVDQLQMVVSHVIPGAEVVALEANQDWLEQITEALVERHGAALASNQPPEPISIKMIFRGLYHLALAVMKSYSHQLMTYLVERHKRLGLLKVSASDIKTMPPALNPSGLE